MRPGRAADHLPPSSAAVMEEYSYTCTHPLGHTGPVTGSLYLYLFSNSGDETWEVRRQIEDNSGRNIFKKDKYWADFEPGIQNPISSCQILRTCHLFPLRIFAAYELCRGSDSVVGIATGYGLDGPGMESRWG